MKPGRVPKQDPLNPRRKGSGRQMIEETDMETGRRTTRPAGRKPDPNDVGDGACSFILLAVIGTPFIFWIASNLF